ncbi:MAG: cation diffusion facilitator family transporter [Candidatus Omnitrophica bacterium]|jgi:cobalt-zinc-cadmium efflux system protein|nr:cation diffusion facilitator family transporter [Candidatus Omnitrophota bacterium]
MISRNILQNQFKVFIILSVSVFFLEIFGGILTHSLALLSDAGHIFVDVFALSLTYFSIWIAQKKANEKFSFGYYRAEILAAVINSFILILITLFIFYNAYHRFIHPQRVNGFEMFPFAIIGFCANFYVVTKMHQYENENLNIKAAYLHTLSDMLASIGVIAASILIIITRDYIFDPIISSIIGLMILFGAIKLVKDSTMVLMETTPENINLEKLSQDILKIPGVEDVHDIHVWSISSDIYALNSHIMIDTINVKSVNEIISNINDMLEKKYNITHTVIQSECEKCVDIKQVSFHKQDNL